jgi:hypothetical protein
LWQEQVGLKGAAGAETYQLSSSTLKMLFFLQLMARLRLQTRLQTTKSETFLPQICAKSQICLERRVVWYEFAIDRIFRRQVAGSQKSGKLLACGITKY